MFQSIAVYVDGQNGRHNDLYRFGKCYSQDLAQTERFLCTVSTEKLAVEKKFVFFIGKRRNVSRNFGSNFHHVPPKPGSDF